MKNEKAYGHLIGSSSGLRPFEFAFNLGSSWRTWWWWTWRRRWSRRGRRRLPWWRWILWWLSWWSFWRGIGVRPLEGIGVVTFARIEVVTLEGIGVAIVLLHIRDIMGFMAEDTMVPG